MPESEHGVVAEATDLETAAMDGARALARAIAESATFRAFEEARDTLMTDVELTRRLRGYQRWRQEFETARSWGGGDPREGEALQPEWRALAEAPAVREYLRTQDDLVVLLREVAALISQEIGMDYASACTPTGGCCG
jgi:cell fate (sporulation/competence/biofilm development) regulator YlbF (YheA/YmcA/DUF963 family)